MSIRNAGQIIREARLKAGLTQEQLSDGICSLNSLSRIELGSLGVSPSTFHTLMAHAGVSAEVLPIFASRQDFDCFYSLKRAHFFWDYWQLDATYDELNKIENMHWANNKYYYQEWLLLHCKLQNRSGCGDHKLIYDTLLEAIYISRPKFNVNEIKINEMLLSITEIELFIALAHESFYNNDLSTCNIICSQISTYLESSSFASYEKEALLAENAVVYAKYLLAIKDYERAYETADHFRLLMIDRMNDVFLRELTFLIGISLYYINKTDEAMEFFRTTIYSSHAIGSCYATICLNYIKTLPALRISSDLLKLPSISFKSFELKTFNDDISLLGDGIYTLDSPYVLTLGGLIRELRTEQKVSQIILCKGLCSKSTLSKIENDTTQPDIALAQALLQRLGIDDKIFSFLGNSHETQLQEIQEKAIHTLISFHDQNISYINSMEKLVNDKDLLYKQYIEFKKFNYIDENLEKIAQLRKALDITLPNFDISHILDYRLSWLELTILNNLSAAYADSSTPSVGIQYFYKILEYLKFNNIDILFYRRIYGITLTLLFRRLYRYSRYSEMIELYSSLSSSSICIMQDVRSSANIYAHLCQAFGECKYTDKMIIIAHYSCSCYKLYNSDKSEYLLKSIYEDFNINIY